MNTVLDGHVAVPNVSAGKWLLAVPVILYALVVYPFMFHDVVGEPDLERMAMAVVYGASSGLGETAGYHYGLAVSFGYYAALYHLLPQSVLLSSSALIEAINFIGFASAVVTVGVLGLYIARLFGVVAALATCILFAFSPMFLDLGTSGHPQLPSMALVLVGAWLLTYVTDVAVRGAYRVAAAVVALVMLTAGLSMRGDIVLAFPFITLVAAPSELVSWRAWTRTVGLRLAVLIPAFALCLVQAHAYQDPAGNAGFVANFFASFYKLDTVPRGFVVLVLCTGVASVGALGVLVFSRAARGLASANVLAVLALALPSLLFWLPNSTPGRHLVLVTLAIVLVVALVLVRMVRPAWVVGIAALLVVGNEAIAEVSHGIIERHYEWTYPLLTARRATTSIPMGAFPLDHDAKQDMFMLLREEGRAFARACSGNVLVFAGEPHYMLMSLAEADRSMRFESAEVGNAQVVRARGARCSVDFVDEAAAWRRDVMREFLDVGRDAGWPIYFQESRRTLSDRTLVPAERRFCVEGVEAPAGGCSRP